MDANFHPTLAETVEFQRERIADLEQVNAACQLENARLRQLRIAVKVAAETCRGYYLIPGFLMRRVFQRWLDEW